MQVDIKVIVEKSTLFRSDQLCQGSSKDNSYLSVA